MGGLRSGFSEVGAQDGPQHRQHIFGAFGQGGAFAQQPVAAFGARIERRAGHGENRAPLFQRLQAGRQVRLAGKDKAPAHLLQRGEFAGDLAFRRQHEFALATARRQLRHRLQRRCRAAETGDQ